MSSIVIAGDTSGTVTISAPATAGSVTLTLPTISGTLLQSGTAITVAQGGTGLIDAGILGNVLTSTGTAWTSQPAAISLPLQSTNNGKYLKTNGNVASWEPVADSLPSQSTHAGHYLQTNGNVASWEMITSGVSLNGAESLSNKTLVGPVFQAYQEKIVTIGSIATSTYTLDTSLANIFDITLTVNTTITFTNVSTSGYARPITLIVRQPASSAGKTLVVANAKYTDGVAPVLSTGVNQIDVLTYWSPNGGTSFFGTFAMANVS